MPSYGIRPGVEWYWDGFPRTQYPVNVGWLPGVGYDENWADDEVDLSDGWYEYYGYTDLLPRAGSQAVTWMYNASPNYWPDVYTGSVEVSRNINLQTNITNGPRAAVNAHPTYWPSGLYISGYIRDMVGDTSIWPQTSTTLAIAGALVSSPTIAQVGMKTTQPVGAVTIRFTMPNTYTYVRAKNIKFMPGFMGAWGGGDTWGWDSLKVTGLNRNGTNATASYLIRDIIPDPISAGAHIVVATFPVDDVYGIRVEHVAPGAHGLPNLFINNIEWTATEPTGFLPIHPPDAAASWTDVLQMVDRRNFHCWCGHYDPKNTDFYPLDVVGDINVRGLGHYSSLTYSVDHTNFQRIATLSKATTTERQAPLPPAMNTGNYPICANPPYAALYSVINSEGSTMGTDIVNASSGSVFVGIIVGGGVSQSTFNGYSNLSSFITSLVSTIGASFPSAVIHFVATGTWHKTVPTTLLGFSGEPVSVGGDGRWTNDSAYSSNTSNVIIGDSATCSPLKDLLTVTPGTYSWGGLVTAYGANPTITPVQSKTVDWPIGDVYRHLIGKIAELGPFASKHIVELVGHDSTSSNLEGMAVYADFDPVVELPVVPGAPQTPVWHKYWASGDA